MIKATRGWQFFSRAKTFVRKTVVLCLAFTVVFLANVLAPSIADAETRTLKLYFTHTKERAAITYKKNGRYIPSGLKKVNRFLRDWRRNEPTRMDPRLLDLVWEVYQKTGSRQYIKVISGYRSPKTNSLLRRRGRNVARNSQHILGKAMDFFIPGVSIEKLRALGLKAGVGGVGYYRGSFVHLDTGSVRHWPRMSRTQLARIFPRGRTMHMPADRKPMKGYQLAKADYNRRKRKGGTALALTTARKPRSPGLLSRVFGSSEKRDKKPAPKPKALPAKNNVVRPKKVPKPEKRTVIAALRQPKLPPELVVQPQDKRQPIPEQIAFSFVPDVLTTPKSKPGPRTGAALAVAQALESARNASEEAVRLASLSSADIRASGNSPEVSENISQRVRLALARSRPLSPAEQAAEAQANSALAAALNNKSVKKRAVPKSRPTLLAALPPTPKARPNIKVRPDRAESLADQLSAALRSTSSITRSHPRPAEKVAIATQAKDQARVDGSRFGTHDNNLASGQEELKRRLASVASPKARPRSNTRPLNEIGANMLARPLSLRMVQVASMQPINTNDASLQTVHTKNTATQPKTPNGKQWPGAGRFGSGKTFSLASLQLGNLNGSRVNGWALSRSTRVGRQAQMQSPAFNLTMLQELPEAVFEVGFDKKFRYQIFDQFTEEQLLREAMATHGT